MDDVQFMCGLLNDLTDYNNGHSLHYSVFQIERLILVILSLYFGLTSSGVDNWAHIGGLVFGFILAVLLYRRKKSSGETAYFR